MLHVVKRSNGIFYYRRRVPTECVSAINKSEIFISLKTNDKRIAVRKYTEVNSYYELLFAKIKEQRMKHRIFRFEEVTTINEAGKPVTTKRIDPKAIEALRSAGVPQEEIARLTRDFFSTPDNSQQANQSGAAAQPPVEALTLKELIEDYKKERKANNSQSNPNWSPDKGDETKFRRLMEILGAETPIDHIVRQRAKDVRDLISQLPAIQRDRNSNIDVVARIKLEKQDPNYARISVKQVNSHISFYASLFKHAIKEHKLRGENPFSGLQLKKDKKTSAKNARNNFERKDLSLIFRHPLFTDYAAEKKRSQDKLQPYRFWTPLIALFSGARPCELGGLFVKDIVKEDNIWCFDFNDDDPGKCSKTWNSLRRTPIHQTLIDLGFLDFVKAIKAKEISQGKNPSQARLFPTLKHTDKDGFGRFIGVNFNKHILQDASVNLYSKNKRVFYSFRHTFTTELYRAGIDGPTREQLCGRDSPNNSVGDQIYLKADRIPDLFDKLMRLNFKNELSNVHKFNIAWI